MEVEDEIERLNAKLVSWKQRTEAKYIALKAKEEKLSSERQKKIEELEARTREFVLIDVQGGDDVGKSG